MNQVLHLRARAKLNLVLRIVGRRADGYHLLETLYQAIELHDDVYAAPAASGTTLTLTADHPRAQVSAGPENLALVAVERFRAAAAAAGRPWPVGLRLHLHKRIPAGAGLGGGSSDAAATLRLCNAIAGGVLSPDGLTAVARGLGADVPFFLVSGPQWGRGIGDELSPAPGVPARHVLLLLPPFACATAEVYKSFAAQLNTTARPGTLSTVSVHLDRDSEVRDRFVNDLEAAAERVRPELAEVRAAVVAGGFPDVRMTGSGSTLFLAFTTASARDAASDRLTASLAPLGVRCLPTRTAGAVDPPEPGSWPPGGG